MYAERHLSNFRPPIMHIWYLKFGATNMSVNFSQGRMFGTWNFGLHYKAGQSTIRQVREQLGNQGAMAATTVTIQSYYIGSN